MITTRRTFLKAAAVGLLAPAGCALRSPSTKQGALVNDVHSQLNPTRVQRLIDANGAPRRCSRSENPELFRLAIGGYGLFGPVYSLQLRLVPRRKLQRMVEIIDINELPAAFENRISNGFRYGDFQFAIDSHSDDFLRKGVFSCYQPVPDHAPMPPKRQLAQRHWENLVYLAHVDPTRAFQIYAEYYRSTSGQIYWSDRHQFSNYLHDYHRKIDQRLGAPARATEMITELYVPPHRIAPFMEKCSQYLREKNIPVIYGTIRRIEADVDSFLPWAKQTFLCVIFNLHVEHTSDGIERAAGAFRHLIDCAVAHGGNYYLTYHRYTTPSQLLACYPQFPEFLRLKKHYDPEERFQSDWYRHYCDALTPQPG